MTPGNWIALASLIALIVIPLAGALISHVRHDERREARLKRVEDEIGTHETGLRGSVHDHAQALTWLGGCLWYLASKLGIELPKRDK